jgi:hypothetical protein
MQREGAVPDSFIQNKMTRIESLDQNTKHLELLVRAALKSVFEFCSLILRAGHFQHHQIAYGSPTIDIFFCFFFCQCSHSTILRGWPCQPRIPAGRSPCPAAPFSPYTATSSPGHHPSRLPVTVEQQVVAFVVNSSRPSLTTSRLARLHD